MHFTMLYREKKGDEEIIWKKIEYRTMSRCVNYMKR